MSSDPARGAACTRPNPLDACKPMMLSNVGCPSNSMGDWMESTEPSSSDWDDSDGSSDSAEHEGEGAWANLPSGAQLKR